MHSIASAKDTSNRFTAPAKWMMVPPKNSDGGVTFYPPGASLFKPLLSFLNI